MPTPENHPQNKDYHINRQKVAQTVLILTAFIPLTTQSGLGTQLLSSLDKYLIPVAEASPTQIAQKPLKLPKVQYDLVVVKDEKLVNQLGAATILINSKEIFVVDDSGKKTIAPDGQYKLSNNLIIEVAQGKVINQAIFDLGNKNPAANGSWDQSSWTDQGGWKDWSRGSAIDSKLSNVARTLPNSVVRNTLQNIIQQEVKLQKNQDIRRSRPIK
ncbi:hypothetical protein [Sphaerospermopsis torques-reginae]|uniref:Uncharacterized protein n=1 Tax=Sphaerospermopsis torques-reginae ITEP-024 TaxID=984208 RepID=A0ABX8X2M5_9CYAN|nr:hypothetical protein [Sphaerospermopsis torques-reginae]QYX32778.1 hypothetical protein K2F26_05310 [Sphaerospermopsis torques-reginae ITEP-024]